MNRSLYLFAKSIDLLKEVDRFLSFLIVFMR